MITDTIVYYDWCKSKQEFKWSTVIAYGDITVQNAKKLCKALLYNRHF